MAERVASGDHPLIAPTLVIAESCNAVWKRLRRGEVAADHAQLVVARLTIARALDHPVYDCFYLALAEKEAAALVTADRRLVERVRATPWEGRVVALDAWVATA